MHHFLANVFWQIHAVLAIKLFLEKQLHFSFIQGIIMVRTRVQSATCRPTPLDNWLSSDFVRCWPVRPVNTLWWVKSAECPSEVGGLTRWDLLYKQLQRSSVITKTALCVNMWCYSFMVRGTWAAAPRAPPPPPPLSLATSPAPAAAAPASLSRTLTKAVTDGIHESPLRTMRLCLHFFSPLPLSARASDPWIWPKPGRMLSLVFLAFGNVPSCDLTRKSADVCGSPSPVCLDEVSAG